ncbi:MAG: class I SAM-dependent methyltransferase [Candidatus Omnitrophica bacterium]|nr:class I SAM-dependent methyltransferase [Candidatus Omnitrophota bacterium]
MDIAVCRWVYRKSKEQLWRKLFKTVRHEPWMFYEEMEVIENLLKHLRPQNCLEWGAGGSTLYFPLFLNKDTKWFTVEHDKDWALKIKNASRDSRVQVFHISPNQFSWIDTNGEGVYADLADYIEFPQKFGKFDFILIDGRARKDCLTMAHTLIKDNGVVVLHDAERQDYHGPFGSFKYQILLSDYHGSVKSLWIGSKEKNIRDIIDPKKYAKLWSTYEVLRRWEKNS